MAEVLPDAEVIAVAWAKADPDLTALLSGRVATRLPADPTFPFLRVFRVTGGREDNVPIDGALLQWDAFAAAHAGSSRPDHAAASDVARTLVAKASEFSGPIGEGFVYGFSRIIGPQRVSEPDREWARYRVDMLLTIRALAGA